MCHATRENGESKQMLELYRNITIVVEDLLSVLQRKLKSATNQYEEVIVENEAFVHSMSLWMKDHVSVSIEASQQYRHLVETEISDTMVILKNVTESQLDIFSDELSVRLADLQHHEMNAFRNVLNEEFVVFEKMLQHAKQDLMAYRNTIQDTTTAMDTLHMFGIHTAEQTLDLQRVQEKILVRATESLTNIEETATKLDKSVMLSSLVSRSTAIEAARI
ncbi:protein of unknown function [Taphrina deformans PYCC 5710]|uniref:Uncharacterized protein n=1 Tax=Taphrina deformans (strain PYCC 5710 / ATCC 11124 / CBS 356.35 / IMI 108563 / JCM 9778 / NBRC 8474) TaxID=1097556 RepID=R4XAP9_TAPDE|nr:protein of unknown function [Taphrina deformans PYCC 5710]|eukprot:CCG82883.1 protein of unknown function [Taphrina deformans PYCC 5710]